MPPCVSVGRVERVAQSSERHVVLAFDFGLRRVGIAHGQSRHTHRFPPLTTLKVRDTIPWPDIDRVIDEWRPGQLVVGLPEGDGAASIARAVRAFVVQLGERYTAPGCDRRRDTHVGCRPERAHERASLGVSAAPRPSATAPYRVAACLIAEQWLSQI